MVGVTVVCGALVTSGCGTRSAGPGVAKLTSTESTSAVAGSPASSASSSPATKGPATALAHAECMRSHGLPDFPDPGPIQIDVKAHPDLDPNSPQFGAAQKACQSLEPVGAAGNGVSSQARAAALAYSACMRSHGFPKLPDPVFDSRGEHVAINGIDTDSAQFQNADKACQTSTGLNGHPSAGP